MRDTLLIACGSASSRAQLRMIFGESFNLLEAETGKQALLLLEQNLHCTAAVLLDMTVRGKGGHTVMSSSRLSEIPLLVILNGSSQMDEPEAFANGANDVIMLPCDPLVIQSRVQTIVDLHRHKWHLQELLDEQALILRHSNEVMVDALSSIIEYRSVESGQHILRIRRFTRILLEEISRTCPEYDLTPELIDMISSAAVLHDVGKIAIPDSILNKPGPLTTEERITMQTHALTGCRILESLAGTGNEEYLRYAHNICHYHHERWDGSGYPEGLAGEDIPICAQVVALADVYDALTADRIYKKAYSFDRAANMILNGECGVFSPKLLDCFKQVSPQMVALAQEYADGRSPKSDHITTPLPGPTPQTGPDSLQMTRMKYNALLHHLNAVVAEADLDHGIYHIVYNPDPNLAALHDSHSFDETEQILLNKIVYHEDKDLLLDVLHQQIPQFLTDGLRRKTHSIRFRNIHDGSPEPYRVTILRLNLGDPDSRQLLFMFEKTATDTEKTLPDAAEWQSEVFEKFSFHSTACFTICRSDRSLSLKRYTSHFPVMLGYTGNELSSLFQDKLSAMIHPDDWGHVTASLTEQLTKGTSFELEYRLLHKSGRAVWVFHRGQLMSEPDGSELLCGMMLDISHSVASREELVEALNRQQIVLSQTQNVIFEWDMRSDTMQYFGDWAAIFGYQPLSQNLLAQLETASHFHPEDIPEFRGMMQNLREGKDYQVLEARLATADGRYLWCRFRATAVRNDAGELTKVVGLIANVDKETRQAQQLQLQAERDPLTKLLNKNAVRKYAEGYLSSSASVSTQAALIIIDLDNFKMVNDRHGHMFGDAVLTQVSTHLRRFFRTDDIVARIGGDEFLVLIKGISSRSLIQDRCKQIVSQLKTLLNSLAPDCGLSCSVGVSLCPEHGTTYNDLFRRADQALYQAKGSGKNGYLIFDSTSPTFARQRKTNSAISARIDSNEPFGLAENSLVKYAFQRLYESGDIEDAMVHTLGVVGQQMNVSRVYIFENNAENTHCSNTFEWCNEGIQPEIQNLQNISYEEDIPGYKSQLSEHGILYCTDIAQLPEDLYSILAPQGIKSLLHCAIYDRGVFRGYIGFDDCISNRLWTKEQIDALTFFSELMAVFLLKKRAQDETQRYAADLASVLDNQNAWIYVIDPDDCTLKFLNAKTRSLAPNAQIGMKCHQCLMGSDERCSNCPALDIRNRKNSCVTIDNYYLGLSVEAESTLIRWGGKEACLLTCREHKA